MGRYPGVFVRGMAMGAADVVPGVSGGTIALVVGVYGELIESLSRWTPALLGTWRREGFRVFWQRSNLGFLLSLLGGILTAIVLLARVLIWTMAHYPVPLWSFFCGLIVASVILLMRPVNLRRVGNLALFLGGVLIGAWIVSLPPLGGGLSQTPLLFFLSGAVAICAMILPGISGSFILVILGMYAPVLQALSQGQFGILAIFAAGCATGLLSFVHVLRWLLRHHHDPVVSLLVGFMGGSLMVLWPWRVPVSEGSTLLHNVSPAAYAAFTGQPSMLPLALLAALAGLALVLLMSWRAGHISLHT